MLSKPLNVVFQYCDARKERGILFAPVKSCPQTQMLVLQMVMNQTMVHICRQTLTQTHLDAEIGATRVLDCSIGRVIVA